MKNKITFSIDGRRVAAQKGMTVLDAATENGIYIPHLCHHPDLKPQGVCRLCGVEVNGRLNMSCLLPVSEGLEVITETRQVQSTRRIALEMLIANHHGDCLTCSKHDTCELLKIAAYVGVDQARLDKMRKPAKLHPLDDSNPFFTFDPNKCVVCGICVRTCDEIQGARAIDFANRGFETIVSTFGGKPFVDSVCESCGECVVRCPVGSLSIKEYQHPAYEVDSVCTYCGVGCNIKLGVQGDKVVNVRGNHEADTNRGQLCVKGRFGYSYINHPDRLTKPMVREYLLEGKKRKKEADRGKWVETDWGTALNVVAEKLAKIKTESGGDAIGVFSSAKCTNEENYLMAKITRQVLGTHSVDHCARL
jgi:formate dehydrogenase alpha subunit